MHYILLHLPNHSRNHSPWAFCSSSSLKYTNSCAYRFILSTHLSVECDVIYDALCSDKCLLFEHAWNISVLIYWYIILQTLLKQFTFHDLCYCHLWQRLLCCCVCGIYPTSPVSAKCCCSTHLLHQTFRAHYRRFDQPPLATCTRADRL